VKITAANRNAPAASCCVARHRREKKPAEKESGGLRVFILWEWAWVELNYRPHAYQAGSYEHEFRPEILTQPAFHQHRAHHVALENVLRTSTTISRI
jgi:hypothetical protein